MIKSMTGFAAVTREDERSTIGVTVRALNHRHLDVQLRIPQSLATIEGDVRALIAKHVARGRVELAISLQLRQTPGVEVEFNEEFARALEAALDRARERNLIAGVMTPGDLLRLPQAITIREKPTDADAEIVKEIADRAREAANAALADLDTMRSTEGHHLRADLDQRRAFVAGLVELIATAADEGRAAMEAAADRTGRRSCAWNCRPTRPPWRRKSSAWPRDRTSAKKWRDFAVTYRIGRSSPKDPSRAAGSWTSCCRR